MNFTPTGITICNAAMFFFLEYRRAAHFCIKKENSFSCNAAKLHIWSLESHIKATIGFKIPKTSTEHMQSLKPIETLKQVLVLLIKIESWVVKGTIQKVSTLNSSTRENKKVPTFWTTIHKVHPPCYPKEAFQVAPQQWALIHDVLQTHYMRPNAHETGQWGITSPRTPVRAWQYPSLSSCHGDLLQISEWMST